MSSEGKKRVPRNAAENSSLFKKWNNKWTEWHTVITMRDTDGFVKRISEKGDLLGYRAKLKKLRIWFGKYDNGIYEWRTAGPRGGNAKVVYVGKTSSKGPESLIRRIKCYTRYQSHERDNINQALQTGFQLQVRVLPCEETGLTAEQMEKNALDSFNYKWNDMNQKS